jgi:hypothetical protein
MVCFERSELWNLQNKDLRQTNDAQIAPIVQRQKRQNAKK